MRVVALVIGIVVLAGCGGDSNEKLPVACTEGPQTIVDALAKAPGAVTLDGTPISRCFNRGANADDVQVLGTMLVGAAQQLADQKKALQLGYLVGAAQRGAKRNGLADELVRRLQAEATVDAAQRADYNRGLRAGAAGG